MASKNYYGSCRRLAVDSHEEGHQQCQEKEDAEENDSIGG